MFPGAILVAAMSVCVVGSGCFPDIHDNVVNIDGTLDVTTDADVDHVKPGEVIKLTINASGLDDDGNFEVYFDTTDSDPLVVSAEMVINVTIPADADTGDHDVICRRHKKDGTPTDLEFSLEITVE
jgi:hypothetical protein